MNGTNLLSKEYIAFTEPDPDGNSYQPGPEREVFVGLQLRFWSPVTGRQPAAR